MPAASPALRRFSYGIPSQCTKLTGRLELLGKYKSYGRELQITRGNVTQAAKLAKCDLMTRMVGEFPELQGIMGRYYARHDDEPAAVADAIEALGTSGSDRALCRVNAPAFAARAAPPLADGTRGLCLQAPP